MRVFLDTNVLVSAFATRGLCADVLRAVLAEHDLATSEFVLSELERVLPRQFGVPQEQVRAIVAFLRRFHVEPASEAPSGLQVRDPDDVNVLASALALRADVLVTGDRDLLEFTGQVAVAITDPRGFWTMLKERGRE